MKDARTVIARKRRRRALVLLLLFVVLPLALVGGAVLFVQSPAGEALVRARVLAALGDALAGKIESGTIELRGNHLVLTDLKLFTPEGELVASIDRLEADVDLAGLARERLHLEDVKIESPKLLLKEDEGGWNLLRAVAPRKPATLPAAATGPNRWRLQFDGVTLTGGHFDFQQEGRRITATKLTARGDAKVRLEPLEIAGSLALGSQLTSPLEETLEASIAADTAQGPQMYDLSVTLGGTRLKGHAQLPALALTIDELVAAPRELKAFLPWWPLVPVVFGKGSLSPKHAALQLSAGKARVTLDGRYDLGTSSAQTLVLKGSNVDFSELVGAAVPSALGFELTGAFADWRPETLAGSLQGKATWDAKGGQRLASANLSASAQKGSLSGKADVTSPGLTLRLRGTATGKNVDAFGTLEADDLGALGKTLYAFAAVDVPGLGGNGTVRVSLKGPLRGPQAQVIGELKRLSIAGIRAEVLALDAEVPDVSQPLDTDVLLHAQRLHFGERSFDDVTFDLITHGRQLDVDLATKGMGDLHLHSVALLDKDSRGAALERLELTSADAKWQLDAPMKVGWTDGLTLSAFSLRDGVQRIAGELEVRRGRVAAKVQVERLDLARLPHVLALPSLGLGGTLTADAVATGKLARPEVTLRAGVEKARLKGVDVLDLKLDGSWADEHAKGTLKLQSALGNLDGTFDVPVLSYLDEKPGDGTAHFTFSAIPLKRLGAWLDRPLPLDGLVSGVIDLSGSGDHPKARVTLESDELTLTRGQDRLGFGGTQLSVFTTDAATLDATVRFSTLGAESAFALATPLTIAALRRHLPTADELLALPVTVQLGVKHLDLEKLDELHLLQDDELAGTVSLEGTISGSVKAPVGALSLTLADVTWPPLRKLNGNLALRTDADRTRLTATASFAEQPQALELTASVAALPSLALAALLGPGGDGDAVVDALRDAPVELLVVLKPVPLAKAVATSDVATPPGGVLSATLEAGGTLDAPTARLVGSLKDLKFDRVALGSARFDLRSTGAEQRFTIVLGGEGRDDFKAKGTLGLDLRLSSLRHGLDWRKAALDLTLDSRNFDLSFLSGSSDLVRVVAGRVDLSSHVTGTLGDPHFVGDATVRGGRLALAGLGDYRDISLEVHADDDLVDVKKFETRSGAGSVQLVARAVRQSTGAFQLTSTGSSDRFPVVFDDQLQANVSLRYVLEGDVTPTLVDIRGIQLPRVEVTLPEVKRKDLQDLQRPKDIIVLRSGSRASRRLRQAVKDEVTTAQGAAQTPLVIRAIIDAPRNVWVRSSDLNVELGLSEGFRLEFNEGLRLFGEARIIKGDLEVIGREFTVQKGSEARFAGPPAQPYVNVSALHVNTREQVKITVTVAGKGTDLSFKTSSEPGLPESDIYAILATGRRNLKTSGGATFTPGQAASVVGQLAASQLKTVIAKKLPIDVFNFDTTDNLEKFKLDVGKYLSDTLYLGASVDIGAKRERGENVWAGRLELQVSKSVTLEAYAGDALSFGADAMWSRDF